jgi:hypothetical protein
MVLIVERAPSTYLQAQKTSDADLKSRQLRRFGAHHTALGHAVVEDNFVN